MTGRARGDSGAPWIHGALIGVIAAGSIAANIDVSSPPRFDGAGYAVLAESLARGMGYRGIDHPERPRHAHFPPGYPAALAVLWGVTGRSAAAAHVASGLCTVAATLAAWWWLRRMYRPRVALALGLALAVNWTWGRNGGGIQSEPLFFLLEQAAVLAVLWAGRRGGLGPGLVVGVALASATLTRHVGACLAVAAGLDLWLRGRRRTAAMALAGAAALVLPWIGWLASVREPTQAGLLSREHLAGRVARQALFYIQRTPDQLVGPVVEIGTVFRRSPGLRLAVNGWALAATALIAFGLIRALRSPRRRLAALVPLVTLGLLLAWPFTEAGRFLVPLVPFLLLGAEEGLARLLAGAGVRGPRGVAAAAILAASVPYAAYSLVTGRAEAQRRTMADFDAACAWIARRGGPPGPILTRHPGEAYWQTGRQALAPDSDDSEAIARLADRFRVAYLLVDDERYARAPRNPLHRFVERFPGRARPVWARSRGDSSIAVYALEPAPPARVDRGRPLGDNPPAP